LIIFPVASANTDRRLGFALFRHAGLLIEFGPFRYVTAGDSDGEYATSGFGYTYNDVESMIARTVGAVDVMQANHHGSGHSTNAAYVAGLDPQLTFISCGYANTHNHPAQGVLNRLFAGKGDIFLNNVCAIERDYGRSIIVEGDIVLRSGTGHTFAIGNRQYTSKNAWNGGSNSSVAAVVNGIEH
jgi:hypothetical protein